MKPVVRFALLFSVLSASVVYAQEFTITPNSPSVGKYDKFEVEITVTFSDEYSNPFDPSDVDMAAVFTAPSSVVWTIPAFWDGSTWRVRFAPDEAGMWEYYLYANTSTDSHTSEILGFDTVESSRHGWVRTSDDDVHYFERDDGTSLIGIGHCRPWWLDVEDEGNVFDPDLVQTNNENQLNWNGMALDTLYADMAAHGMNWHNYWLAPWDNTLVTSDNQFYEGYVGSGYDRYEMTSAQKLDRIVETAEQYGIHLTLSLWPHDALRDTTHNWYVNWNSSEWWSMNPFNQLSTCEGFFTDVVSWEYQQKLYRYIIARWGYSSAIGMWDVAVELDGTCAYGNAAAWLQKTTDYFVNNDPFGHPVTGSKYNGGSPWDEGLGIMDVAHLHSYEYKYDPVAEGQEIAYQTRYMWDYFAKPNVVGEFGTDDQLIQPDHMHAGVWSSIMAGAAVGALDWNDGGHWGDMTPEMYDHMYILSEFVKGVPFDKLGLHQAAVSSGGLNALGMSSADFAVCWVQDPAQSGTVTGGVLVVDGLADGTYDVEWWDTWNLDVNEQPVIVGLVEDVPCTGGTLTVDVPDFAKDSACKISVAVSEPAVMHVAGIEMATRKTGANVCAIATVTIEDAVGAPVSGASVSGFWSGITFDSDTGITDGAGRVSVESDSLKKPSGVFTFTVTDVAKNGCTYNPSEDIETFGSINSDGTPVTPIHDVAVSDIVCPGSALAGSLFSVDVGVVNEGTYDELSVLTLTDLTTGFVLGQTDVALAAGATDTVTFSGLSLVQLGDHVLQAEIDAVPGEQDTADNTRTAVVNVTDVLQKMHVAGIAMTLGHAGPNTTARAAVTIVDSGGTPVTGATVSGVWSGLTSDGDTGTTAGDGIVELSSDKVRRTTGTFTFTITGVVKDGWLYDAAANVESSDSISN